MQVVRKRTKLSFPNHPSATSISNRKREVPLSIYADSHKKEVPVIQYAMHRKKLNIHADSTKPLLPVTRLLSGKQCNRYVIGNFESPNFRKVDFLVILRSDFFACLVLKKVSVFAVTYFRTTCMSAFC